MNPRLIPSVADNALERRGVSILLSALTAVHEYRKVMLESIGHRVGQRARLEAWTEVVFPDEKSRGKKNDERRPDGAIVLNTGKKTWRKCESLSLVVDLSAHSGRAAAGERGDRGRGSELHPRRGRRLLRQ